MRIGPIFKYTVPQFGSKQVTEKPSLLPGLEIAQYFPPRPEQRILKRLMRSTKVENITQETLQLANHHQRQGNLYLGAKFKDLAAMLRHTTRRHTPLSAQNLVLEKMANWAANLQDQVDLLTDPETFISPPSVLDILLRHYPDNAKIAAYHTRFVTAAKMHATAKTLQKAVIYGKHIQGHPAEKLLEPLYQLASLLVQEGKHPQAVPLYRFLLDMAKARRYADTVEEVADDLGGAYLALDRRDDFDTLGKDLEQWRRTHLRPREFRH